MATYLILNLIFLAVVLAVLGALWSVQISRTVIAVLAVLLVLTAIFDSLIIAFDIVRYDPDKLLGLYIGHAPVEDFFYAVLAAIVIPSVWRALDRRHHA